jgi:predicted nucleotidyltransferase
MAMDNTVLTRAEIERTLREEYPHLAAEYSVKRIGLFGSYATGMQTEASDIDIVIDFEQPIGLRFVELAEYLESVLGRAVDVLTPAGIRAIRLEGVAREIERSIVYVS